MHVKMNVWDSGVVFIPVQCPQCVQYETSRAGMVWGRFLGVLMMKLEQAFDVQ